MKVRELLSDESKWTGKINARDKYGRPTNERSKEAVCWCLTGAINKCYPPEDIDEIVMRVIASTGGELTIWNDAPERKFEDVKKLCEEIDI